jgi:peptidoglycan/xylan/chitin deacetylase (PgdA/CDA1 family)
MRKAAPPFLVAVLLVCFAVSPVISAPPAPCSGGRVALTFDDGPTLETNDVLDELRLYNLKATFFLIGVNVQQYPDITRRIVQEGHDVANHTWSHRDLTTLSAQEVTQELQSTNDLIRQLTGVQPKFVRPPYGATNPAVEAEMTRNGLVETIWSQDSWDWDGTSTEDIVNELTLVPPGGVYLMHDRMPNTLAAISGFDWYFNTYWANAPICSGKLAATTNVQPVLDWMGLFYFAHAVPWP